MPLPSPEQRVTAIMGAWGRALQDGSDEALAATEDGGGRFALVYAATKIVASTVPNGGQAVENTLGVNLLLLALQTLWPGFFGSPTDEYFVELPTGPLGPALVAAGLVEPLDDARFTDVAVSKEDTFGRAEEAMARHRERLREQEAWTCEPVAIEQTILPTEPSLKHAATRAAPAGRRGSWSPATSSP